MSKPVFVPYAQLTEEQKRKVDCPFSVSRIEAVHCGLGWDVLKNDEDPEVRKALVYYGYDLDYFATDTHDFVREMVAFNALRHNRPDLLAELESDISHWVRDAVQQMREEQQQQSCADATPVLSEEEQLHISTHRLIEDIKYCLSRSIADDYLNEIWEEIGEDIAVDVIETSAFKDEGQYSLADIRLAIGRVLLQQFSN